METNKILPIEEAYPVITNKVMMAVNNAVKHIFNGCISDKQLPYVKTGEVNFYNCGVILPVY